MAIARDTADNRGEEEALGNLAASYDAKGDLRGAIECYDRQLAIGRARSDDRIERKALKSLKLAYKYLANYEQANYYRQQQLAIVRQLFFTENHSDFVQLAEIVGLNPAEDFAGVDLSNFDLQYADFAGADLRDANLSGVDFRL